MCHSNPKTQATRATPDTVLLLIKDSIPTLGGLLFIKTNRPSHTCSSTTPNPPTHTDICTHKEKEIINNFPGGPVPKTPLSDAGGLGLIPGQGTRSRMPQPRSHRLQLRSTAAKLIFKSNNFPEVKAMGHQIQQAYRMYKS